MNKTIRIEGMTCGHCTASVEKALRGVPGVTDVKVDLAGKTAAVAANDTVADSDLAAAVDEIGFDVVGIQ
jgi:copper chaperone CopZ